MAAMAGVPLTAGFMGKLFVFQSIVGDLHWLVVIVALISAIAGFYYYFKIIRAIYWHNPTKNDALIVPSISRSVILLLTIAIFIVGIYPKAIECLIGN